MAFLGAAYDSAFKPHWRQASCPSGSYKSRSKTSLSRHPTHPSPVLSRVSITVMYCIRFTQSEVMSYMSLPRTSDLEVVWRRDADVSLVVYADMVFFRCWKSNVIVAEYFIFCADWDCSDSCLLGLDCLYSLIYFNTFYLWERFTALPFSHMGLSLLDTVAELNSALESWNTPSWSLSVWSALTL